MGVRPFLQKIGLGCNNLLFASEILTLSCQAVTARTPSLSFSLNTTTKRTSHSLLKDALVGKLLFNKLPCSLTTRFMCQGVILLILVVVDAFVYPVKLSLWDVRDCPAGGAGTTYVIADGSCQSLSLGSVKLSCDSFDSNSAWDFTVWMGTDSCRGGLGYEEAKGSKASDCANPCDSEFRCTSSVMVDCGDNGGIGAFITANILILLSIGAIPVGLCCCLCCFWRWLKSCCCSVEEPNLLQNPLLNSLKTVAS